MRTTYLVRAALHPRRNRIMAALGLLLLVALAADFGLNQRAPHRVPGRILAGSGAPVPDGTGETDDNRSASPSPPPPAGQVLTAPPPPAFSDPADQAVLGTLTYSANPDGTINEDQGWLAAHIATQTLPILGPTTCNRLLFGPLQGALNDLQSAGLAKDIDLTDAGNHADACWQPRFVNWDPGRGLSYHAWGFAIDLNPTSNPTGGPSRQDPQLVSIFQQWGFAWGGTWADPAPMHFELDILQVPLAPAPVSLTGTVTSPVAAGTATTATAYPSAPVSAGSFLFQLYAPGDPFCTNSLVTSTVVVTSGLAMVNSGPLAVGAAGNYQVVISYTGTSQLPSTRTTCGAMPVSVVGKGGASYPAVVPSPSPVASPSAAGSPAQHTTPSPAQPASPSPSPLPSVAPSPTYGPLSISAVSPETSLALGSSIQIGAALVGGDNPRGGVVSFALYGPGDPSCSAAPAVSADVTFTGPSNLVSASLQPPAPGDYTGIVTYSGDARNQPVTTSCGAVGVSVTS